MKPVKKYLSHTNSIKLSEQHENCVVNSAATTFLVTIKMAKCQIDTDIQRHVMNVIQRLYDPTLPNILHLCPVHHVT